MSSVRSILSVITLCLAWNCIKNNCNCETIVITSTERLDCEDTTCTNDDIICDVNAGQTCYIRCRDSGCQNTRIFSSNSLLIECDDSNVCQNTKIFCGNLTMAHHNILLPSGYTDNDFSASSHSSNSISCTVEIDKSNGFTNSTFECYGDVINECNLVEDDDNGLNGGLFICDTRWDGTYPGSDCIVDCIDINCDINMTCYSFDSISGTNQCDCGECTHQTNIFLNSNTNSNTNTATPSVYPTTYPTANPTIVPSILPSVDPTVIPTIRIQPTIYPISNPSMKPSRQPSGTTREPTLTLAPTKNPSSYPTTYPSRLPSVTPSDDPSYQPTSDPSSQPSSEPSSLPSIAPNIDIVPSIATTVNVYRSSSQPNVKYNQTGQILSTESLMFWNVSETTENLKDLTPTTTTSSTTGFQFNRLNNTFAYTNTVMTTNTNIIISTVIVVRNNKNSDNSDLLMELLKIIVPFILVFMTCVVITLIKKRYFNRFSYNLNMKNDVNIKNLVRQRQDTVASVATETRNEQSQSDHDDVKNDLNNGFDDEKKEQDAHACDDDSSYSDKKHKNVNRNGNYNYNYNDNGNAYAYAIGNALKPTRNIRDTMKINQIYSNSNSNINIGNVFEKKCQLQLQLVTSTASSVGNEDEDTDDDCDSENQQSQTEGVSSVERETKGKVKSNDNYDDIYHHESVSISKSDSHSKSSMEKMYENDIYPTEGKRSDVISDVNINIGIELQDANNLHLNSIAGTTIHNDINYNVNINQRQRQKKSTPRQRSTTPSKSTSTQM